MSAPDVAPAEEGNEDEVEHLPPPSDPENPEHAPEDPEADTDGPSDDDAADSEETGEGGQSDEPDEPATATPAPPDTESRLDELTRSLSKAARSYGNRVATIFGDDWQGCVPCPLCATDFPGVLTPAPRSDEVIAAVRPIIGLPDLSNYRADRFARTCERCSGRGKTLTGSAVPQYATMRCPDCNGTGFNSAEQGFERSRVSNGHEAVVPPTHEDEEPTPAMPQASIDALEKMLEAARNAGVGR